MEAAEMSGAKEMTAPPHPPQPPHPNRTHCEDSSKNIQISAFHIFKVFVANPNKPQDIKVILAKNHEKLLQLLHCLSPGKGAEDDQFEEEKELIIKEIERVSQLPNLET
ncbi:hypothetical protein OROGR_014270 [Orobanche gracilis]